MTQCGKNKSMRTWTTVSVEKDVASLWKDFYNLQFAISQQSSHWQTWKELKINLEFMYNKNFMCHKKLFLWDCAMILVWATSSGTCVWWCVDLIFQSLPNEINTPIFDLVTQSGWPKGFVIKGCPPTRTNSWMPYFGGILASDWLIVGHTLNRETWSKVMLKQIILTMPS